MPTLEEVVSAFELWRTERKSKNIPIPDYLWEMTKAVVPYYKKGQIQEALKISGGQFNKHCMNSEEKPVNPFKEAGFAVGTLHSGVNLCDERCELILKGTNKSLQIKIGIQNIGSVLSLVEQYL